MHHTIISNPSDVDKLYCNPEKIIKITGQYEPDELARIIIEETPDAIEPFGSLENMAAYIREAMIAEFTQTT